jgi:outer membrane protein TolC
MQLREKTTKAYIYIFLCSWLFLIAGASVSNAQSIHEAVIYALENNPKIDGVRASQDAASYDSKATQSSYFPEISAILTAGRVYQDNATSRGLSTTRGSAYSGYGEGSLALHQMIYDGMETANKYDASEAREQSRYYGMLDTQVQVAAQVVQNYIESLRLRSALQLIDIQNEKLMDYQDRIKDMADQGMSDESELQQAYDVAMVIDSLRADYEGRLIVAEAAYVQAVGKPVPDQMIVPESVQDLVEKDLDQVIAQAKADHPLVRAAYMQSKAVGYEVEAEQGRLYPDLSGELSHLKSDKLDVIGGESQDSRAVLKMNWSFSTGGKEEYSIKRKRSEHLETLYKVKEIESNIEQGVREAYARYLTFWRKSELSTRRVALNKKLMSTYQSQFEGSRINLLALMRAQSQLFKAELEDNDNSFNLLSAQYGVLTARGELLDVILASTLPAVGKQQLLEE